MRDAWFLSDSFQLKAVPGTDDDNSTSSIWDNNMNSTTYGHLKLPEPEDNPVHSIWDKNMNSTMYGHLKLPEPDEMTPLIYDADAFTF